MWWIWNKNSKGVIGKVKGLSMYNHKIGKEKLSLTLQNLKVCFRSIKMKNLRHFWRQMQHVIFILQRCLMSGMVTILLRAWLPYINLVQQNDVNWHVYVNNFVLHTTCKLIELLAIMVDLNKYVNIKPRGDAWFIFDLFFVIHGLHVIPFESLLSSTMLSHPLCMIFSHSIHTNKLIFDYPTH